MVSESTRRTVLHGIEIAYAFLIGSWYALPFFRYQSNLINLLRLPFEISYAASGTGVVDTPLFYSTALMAYALPLVLLVKLCSPFLAKKAPAFFDPLRLFPRSLDILSSLFVVLLLSLHMLRFGASINYFARLPYLTYGYFGVSIAFNAVSVVGLIRAIKRRDQTYRQYRDFARKVQGGKPRLLAEVARASIRKRLVLSFMGITIFVVAVLSMTLLADFRKTILATLTYNGKSLAERSASVVKANLADTIAIGDYFEIERKKNIGSELVFQSISYYQKRGKSDEYLASSGTEQTLLGKRLAAKYSSVTQTSAFYDPERRVYEFVSPVTLGSESKIVGFSVVVYDRDVIYESYFRTTVKVLLFGAAFVYVATLLVYILGSNIALPILFLRMNVNKISSAISDMISGRAKVSTALLDYVDAVRTRDELKTLSTEIGNMATVIRGVVPYISASTLKHAHRVGLVSEKRDLAFLFTDIRGFTSLCEGLTPEEVVKIVNKYLNLQTGIILGNGGDIDKFMGDAIMAMFEGEDKEMKACRTAMEIREAMASAAEERRTWKEKAVSVGIGINAGPVVFGSVGAKDRMDFTSIGDTVNLAARLEGANKEYGTKSLIGEAVFAKVKDYYVCREIDSLTVKGKSRHVRVYEILQEKKKASKVVFELKNFFEAGLGKYRKKDWDEAVRAFGYLVETYHDRTSAVFVDRIAYYRRNPPPNDWDGVFSLQVK
jgi:class 3 adenylate cyclase